MASNRVIDADNNIIIKGLQWPSSDGNANQVIQTNGSGTLTFTDQTGGGGTGINHVTNPNAETDTTGYASYADAAATTPADGTGGSANVTISRNTSSPLRNTADFKISKDAVNRQGQGISYDFTIDAADKAKKLIISFDYDASHAGYADDDIKVFIYDVTNTDLIRVSSEELKAGKGTHYSQFQTASNSTSYRLIFHISSTNAAAYDVFLDEVSVGPREITHGAIITDWQEYTPTFNSGFSVGTGGNVENKFEYRRVGENIEIRFLISLGTSSASMGTGNFSFTLPAGYNMVSAFALRGDDYPTLGFVRLGDNNTATDYNGQVFPNAGSTNTLVVGIHSSYGVVTATSPITWAGQDFMSCPSITMPIEGWSTNAKISEEFSSREIVAEGAGNGGTSITANVTNIDFTETRDTTGSFNGTTFTAPETGDYLISGCVHISSTPADFRLISYVNSSVSKTLSDIDSTGNNSALFSCAFRFNKGDVFSIRTDGTFTLTNDSNRHWIHIQKQSSAQTILENETVAMRYTSNAGTSIANNTNTVLLFEDKDTDTHGAYNTATGIYTFPTSGYYAVDCKVGIYGRDSTNSTRVFIASSVDGSGTNDITLDTEAAAGSGAYDFFTLDGSYVKYFNKGQTINVFIHQNTGSSQNLTTSTANMYLSIIRQK